MALLNKIKASTLMETLVATVLIVVVFMVSSLLLNNFLSTRIKENTANVEERIHHLEYEYKNAVMQLPYYEEFNSWEIDISINIEEGQKLVVITAKNRNTNKKLTSYLTNAK